MIFVCYRRPKQRHNSITHKMADSSFIPVDRTDHPLKHRVEQSPCIFRITIGKKLKRTLDISEQHSDLLALGFEGVFRRENLLG